MQVPHLIDYNGKKLIIKRTIKELNQLSDAELNDIGLGRGDIYSVAHGDPHHKKSAQVNHNLEGWV